MKVFHRMSMGIMAAITVFSISIAMYPSGSETLPNALNTLIEPAIAQSDFSEEARTDYLDIIDNAGFSAYIKVGKNLEPSLLSSHLRHIALSGPDHIAGIIKIPGFDSSRILYEQEHEEVQIFIHRSGWIMVYLSRFQDPALAIDWVHYGTNRLADTTLSLTLKSVLELYQADGAETIQYFNFAHPTANNFMMASLEVSDGTVTTKSMTLFVPDSITLHHMGLGYEMDKNGNDNHRGNKITCLVDGTELLEFTDASFRNRRYTGHTSYDDVSTFYNFEHTLTAEFTNVYGAPRGLARCGVMLIYTESGNG